MRYDPKPGRFTQEDPIGLAGGMNLYGFAGGDPVNFSDPFGLCKVGTKEKPCRSRDEAARRGMRSIYGASLSTGNEWQGEIIRRGKGYFYTPGREGTEALGTGVDSDIAGFDGWYHSHGSDSHGKYDDENFSEDCGAGRENMCDKPISDNTGKPGYLITPKGRMKRYDPDPTKHEKGKVTDIGKAEP